MSRFVRGTGLMTIRFLPRTRAQIVVSDTAFNPPAKLTISRGNAAFTTEYLVARFANN